MTTTSPLATFLAPLATFLAPLATFLAPFPGVASPPGASEGLEGRPWAPWEVKDDNGVMIWILIWVFPKIMVPQNGWFIMENTIKMDDLGGPPLFLETPIYLFGFFIVV